jgi:hypothetical protein
LRKFIAKTAEEVETFINLLPVDVYILGAPQQVMVKGKKKWIVWFMPYKKTDENYLRENNGS